jgi:hypothetical protein
MAFWENLLSIQLKLPTVNHLRISPFFMSLYRLIYSSHANPDLGLPDLQNIMESSIKNNQTDGITGLLCHANGMFLQVLEGYQDKVNQTYHRIVQDSRHHTPMLISCEPITTRAFEIWSMQALRLTDLNQEQVKTLTLRHSGSAAFHPDRMNPRQALAFMKEIGTLFQVSDNIILDL